MESSQAQGFQDNLDEIENMDDEELLSAQRIQGSQRNKSKAISRIGPPTIKVNDQVYWGDEESASGAV